MTIVSYLFALLLPFAAAAAHAEIYACAGKAKVIVYQNFPCALDSIGSLPTSSAQVQPTAVGLVAGGNAAALRPPDEPRNGMTKEEVRAIWGEPTSTDTHSDEEGLAERSELWSYGGSREVRFVDDRVFAVRK